MAAVVVKKDLFLKTKMHNPWFSELSLPVAPSCNMMCHFCNKDGDCLCTGNNPKYLSKVMTPRQAVSYAADYVARNDKIQIVKITGPGEPLDNHATFEVLRRLNETLPHHVYSIGTNGLFLKRKARELNELRVDMVEVAVTAIRPETLAKMCGRMVLDGAVITDPLQMAGLLVDGMMGGIKLCCELGMEVKLNAVYYPGINKEDILQAALIGKEFGVRAVRIIAGYPGGKFSRVEPPAWAELMELQLRLMDMRLEVEIRSFNMFN